MMNFFSTLLTYNSTNNRNVCSRSIHILVSVEVLSFIHSFIHNLQLEPHQQNVEADQLFRLSYIYLGIDYKVCHVSCRGWGCLTSSND